MAAEDDDPNAAANRLEAALERIARAAEQAEAASPAQDASISGEVAMRLDSLIARLRAELGDTA